MNSKIQAALETLTSKLIAMSRGATAKHISAKFAESEAKGMRYANDYAKNQADSLHPILREEAALFQAFLDEMNSETEESFIAGALDIKAAATELSSEEYSEACRFETALLYGEIHAMCELVAGASNTDKVKQWVLGGDMSEGAVEKAGLVERFGAYVRLTPKGMKIAKYFTGALA